MRKRQTTYARLLGEMMVLEGNKSQVKRGDMKEVIRKLARLCVSSPAYLSEFIRLGAKASRQK